MHYFFKNVSKNAAILFKHQRVEKFSFQDLYHNVYHNVVKL